MERRGSGSDESLVQRLVLVALMAAAAAAQVAAPESIRLKMEQSIQKQKESIRKQAESAVPGDPGWFTVPWTRDKDGAFIAPPAPKGDATREEPAKEGSTADGDPRTAQAFCAPIRPVDLEPSIVAAADRHGVAASTLRAMVAQESAFHPCAVSPKGAMGLMQLMPATAASLGVRDPFDPVESLDAGARYLSQLLTRYSGDLRLALGAYNAGPRRVEKAGAVPAIPETQAYVRRVLGGAP